MWPDRQPATGAEADVMPSTATCRVNVTAALVCAFVLWSPTDLEATDSEAADSTAGESPAAPGAPQPGARSAGPASDQASGASADDGSTSGAGSSAVSDGASTPAAADGSAQPGGGGGDGGDTARTLNLDELETRVRGTSAIGFFTKLQLKGEIDDLLEEMGRYHESESDLMLDDLHERFELLLLKLLTLLQDDDPDLHQDIAGAQSELWAILADPVRFREARDGSQSMS